MEVHRGSESLRPGKFIPEPISPMAGQSLEAADREDVVVGGGGGCGGGGGGDHDADDDEGEGEDDDDGADNDDDDDCADDDDDDDDDDDMIVTILMLVLILVDGRCDTRLRLPSSAGNILDFMESFSLTVLQDQGPQDFDPTS